MTKELNITKPLQLRDGREYRLYTTAHPVNENPIVGGFKGSDGKWRVIVHAKDGAFISGDIDNLDLINTPSRGKK